MKSPTTAFLVTVGLLSYLAVATNQPQQFSKRCTDDESSTATASITHSSNSTSTLPTSVPTAHTNSTPPTASSTTSTVPISGGNVNGITGMIAIGYRLMGPGVTGALMVAI